MTSTWWGWLGLLLFASSSTWAQDIRFTQYNPSNPNDQYNPYSSSSTEQPQSPFNQPQYGQIDPFGLDNRQNQSSVIRRPTWRPSQTQQSFGRGRNELDNSPISNVIITEASYFIVASKVVRPAQLYRVAVTVLKMRQSLTVRASIQRNGVEMSADSKDVKEGIPETLLMRVPPTSEPGEYKLRIEGLYDNILGGVAFANETRLVFSQRSMSIFIQLDKPVYMQSEMVHFRTIPIDTELRAFDKAVDVYMLDPQGHIMRRWLSRQSNLGTVSLSYQLSDQPIFGDWKVKVIAQGQVEEATFSVEEYYQTRFEVNVTMPAFFFSTDEFIHGIVMANYTSGAPVHGNLTLKATVRPIQPLGYDENRYSSLYNRNDPLNKIRNPNDPRDRFIGDVNRDRDRDNSVYTDSMYGRGTYEKYFNFDEKLPFWFDLPEYHYDQIPHMRFFNGVYAFKYPMAELLHFIPSLEGMEIIITAKVGERFLDEVIEGYSVARIFNSSIKVAFLGDSPQVFKAAMPTTCYIAASFHDGSSLSLKRLQEAKMEIVTNVEMRGGGRREVETREIAMSENPGIWKYDIDLITALNLDGPRAQDVLNDVSALRITATYKEYWTGDRVQADLLMLNQYSPTNKQIKVYTSNNEQKVGEYIVLHVATNYYINRFNYMIISKGIVLVTSDEAITNNIRTMTIALSAEMAPVATVVVWHVGLYGEVTADSLTFPVNGISRNKFKVFINNKKARTGHKVEVAIYGEPGSYVGLSGIDRAFYTMQAGNELSYAKVIMKMASFDEGISNGTLSHIWSSHEGNPDDLLYFPASTYGIDVNRTFEYAGLVVFTDIVLERRPSWCNASQGYGECLNGRCYRLIDQRCNGIMDCEDGTDEAGCRYHNETELVHFRKFRFNRIQRQYENVWLWRDVNIGPHGRYIFNLDVPARPVHWMVSAFGISPSLGFGMLNKAIEYIGVLPFFINVEMPSHSRQGEQVGIRCTVFNYMTNAIEATVVLSSSKDFKFVHVDDNGIVPSYNPRTSFGEHQFFIYIPAQDAVVVYVPIVPVRLGDIQVTINAVTLIGKDQITRTLHVEADGVPQYRHQAIMLDLSNRAYAFQYMHVNVTETPIIPYDADRYYIYGSNKARISVVGDVVGPIFPTMPVNATSLLHLPMDSAEQNMFSFAANLYTTMYMRYINQRNKTKERLSFYHMNIGYQRQLSFMQPDGSFSLFRSDWNQSASSVWLTAFCVRVFQEASFYEWENYIYIDPVVINKAVGWILQHQLPEGSFYETTWSPDRKYNHSTVYQNDRYRNRNISLTAHVLITLDFVKDLQGGLGGNVSLAQKRAVSWLERNMNLIDEAGEAYDIAIVAYALMLTKSRNAEQAFALLNKHARTEGGLTYWGKEKVPLPPYKLENQKPFLLPRLPYKYDAENIEATSYALLTYVSRQEILIDPIVRWLNSQRLTDGGWASTQDTAWAMKALIAYTSTTRIRDVSNLTVTVEATSLPGKTKNLYVNKHNLAVLQSIDIPEAWGTVKVQATGAGYAILQMSVQYNVDIAKFQTDPPLRAFDLHTRAHYWGRNQSHITYLSCQKWNNVNESVRSGMAVLDVTIPTGYIIQQQNLDAYVVSRRVRNLQRAKFLSQKVIFYFDYLDEEETCVNFTIERWYPVANMSRYLPIRIYDYYAPERFNETIFDALPTYLLNICEVCGSSQCPYCAIYNAATILPVPILTLVITAVVLIVRQFRLQNGAVI